MYGIFTYIYHKNQPNVGKYTIHGSSGFRSHLHLYMAPKFSWENWSYCTPKVDEVITET